MFNFNAEIHENEMARMSEMKLASLFLQTKWGAVAFKWLESSVQMFYQFKYLEVTHFF